MTDRTLSTPIPIPRVEALKGHAAMLLFAACISGSFSLGHVAAPLIDPAALTALRFAIALAVMAGVLLALRERRVMVARPWRFLFLGGVLGIYFVLMFEALKLSDPVSLAAVFTMTPLMTAAISRFTLGQRPSPVMLASLLLAAAGALWVIFEADWDKARAFDLAEGELIFLIACFAHAIYISLVRRFSQGESPAVFTAWTVSGGLLVVGLYGIPAILATDWVGLPPVVWVTAAYVGIVASAFTFFLMRYAALRLPSAKVMAYGYLVPSFVILIEGTVGHGWVEPIVLVGVAATIAALVVLVVGRDG